MLEIGGTPSGALYLERGHVAFARASWIPGLAARLRGVRQPAPELLDLLRDWDPADPGVAEPALRRRYVSPEELGAVVESIVVDAFVALTTGIAGPPRIRAIRFDSAATTWPEAFPRLTVDAVRKEASQRAERVLRCGLTASTPVVLSELGRPFAIVTRERWALASRINGAMSASDLAQQCGLALADTIEGIYGLIQDGLCVRAPDGYSIRVPVPVPVPVRRPVPPRSPAAESRSEDSPPMDILRQVLNGLRKLS